MSLLNAIANCRKPIGEGKARKVYYSKKYDVVIKRAQVTNKCPRNQNIIEARIFDKLQEGDKEIVPMIKHLKRRNGEIITIWKRVQPLLERIEGIQELHEIKETVYWWRGDRCNNHMTAIVKQLQLIDNVDAIMELIDKYDINDIKAENLGIMNNHLVILDAGWDYGF